MPRIQVKLIGDAFTPTQKSQIVSRLKDAMVSIEGENLRPLTSVAIEEAHNCESGNGKQLATNDAAYTALASFFGSGCF